MRFRFFAVASLLLLLVGFLSACAGKDLNTVSRDVSSHGVTLMKAVKATQQAVIDAEANGSLPRNAAVTSMEVFQRIGQQGERVAEGLKQLTELQAGTPESKSTVETIQQALDVLSSDLFIALAPISDEGTRQQVARLAAEVNRTVQIINREILGGVQ